MSAQLAAGTTMTGLRVVERMTTVRLVVERTMMTAQRGVEMMMIVLLAAETMSGTATGAEVPGSTTGPSRLRSIAISPAAAVVSRMKRGSLGVGRGAGAEIASASGIGSVAGTGRETGSVRLKRESRRRSDEAVKAIRDRFLTKSW